MEETAREAASLALLHLDGATLEDRARRQIA